MKKYFILTAIALMPLFSAAQVYKTSAGKISFVSKTAIEEFSANNAQVEAAIAPAKNQIQFRVPVNGFVFKSGLMQKHFQENYMETSQFQYSNFVGKLSNPTAVNFAQNGEYPKDGAVTLKANFRIKCSDYQIKIPAASAASVADDIAIAVDCALAK